MKGWVIIRYTILTEVMGTKQLQSITVLTIYQKKILQPVTTEIKPTSIAVTVMICYI